MRELTMEIESLIAKARTYGINISKHGFCEEFRKHVKEVDEYIMQQQKNNENIDDELSPSNTNLNIKINGSIP